jgi:cysteinyl-tRNA synthetase
MPLHIYNTMSRKKEEFVPLKRNFARIYTCGLTVYDYMHIGHARTYLFWDVVRRYLKYRGYGVYAIINNTDIDDKNIARANELGISYRLSGDFFTRAFYDDMDALGVRP